MHRSSASTLVAVVACGFAACTEEDPRPPELAQGALTKCHDVTLEGIDVSKFQGTITWSKVHDAGRAFAIARIGDGTYLDPKFAENWVGMQDANLVRGAYHFFRPNADVDAQADMIAEAVGMLGDGDLPVTIDFECMCPYSAGTCKSSGTGCVSPTQAATALKAMAARVEADTGKQPIIYTGAWFWDGSVYFDSAADMGTYPLWVSGYLDGCVTVPSGWSDWTIWQYSDGTCDGCIDQNVPVPGVADVSLDRDRFKGTLADLQAFANGGGGGPALAAAYVTQSFPLASAGAVSVRAGESAEASLELRNVGTATWTSATYLATTGPRDHADPFADASWPSASRPARVADGVTVAPGASYRFTWRWSAPTDAAPGRYDEHYGLVTDGVGWFGDDGGPADTQLEAILEVTPGGTTTGDTTTVESAPDGVADTSDGHAADTADTATSVDAAPDTSASDSGPVAPDGDASDAASGASQVAHLTVTKTPGGCGAGGDDAAAWVAAGVAWLVRRRGLRGTRARTTSWS